MVAEVALVAAEAGPVVAEVALVAAEVARVVAEVAQGALNRGSLPNRNMKG